MSIHLRPTAALAERALLPADPGLALGLAQVLLEKPLMFNHHHGLWGYTGLADDGRPLTVQSTGIGGPSAAIVLEELAGLGLRRAIRVGTCGVSRPASGGPLGLGDLIIVEAALAADGASRALGGGGPVAADGGLTRTMRGVAPGTRRGVVVSTDVFYGAHDDPAVRDAEAGALAFDLETAALLRLGAVRSVAVACVVVVADLLVDGRRVRIDDQGLDDACERAGRLAVAGLVPEPDDPAGGDPAGGGRGENG